MRKKNLTKHYVEILKGKQENTLTILGMISAGLVVLLITVMVNPATGVKVQAIDESNNELLLAANSDGPSVAVSFVAPSTSATLRPTTGAGRSARINMQARVEVENSGGYSVYFKSNSANLIGAKNASHIIPSTSSARTYEDMEMNTWGYHAAEGTTISDTAVYKAPANLDGGDKILENTNKRILSETKDLIVSFAVKLNSNVAADSYQNTAIISVVSSPIILTLSTMSDMQEMTGDICSDSSVLETKQLRDMRDGKYYWATKLADGKCWMTQNLDLDLSQATTLTNADTDLQTAVTWTATYDTATSMTASTVLDSKTGTRSWSLGNAYINTPNNTVSCGTGLSSVSGCKYFTSYTVNSNGTTSIDNTSNAHYILGNHYQWNAATAGSGGSISSGNASSSICPKGWKLPTTTDYQTLLNSYSATSNVGTIVSSPLYFVLGGSTMPENTYTGLYYNPGRDGSLWTSTASTVLSDSSCAHDFRFRTLHEKPEINTAGSSSRSVGRTLRCIVRD